MPLIGGKGSRVMPKPGTPAGISPVVLHPNQSSAHELLNREQALKHLGVRIPSNYTSPKVRTEPERQVMIEQPKPAPALGSKFDQARQKINTALDALVDTEKLLAELEVEHNRFKALQEALRGLTWSHRLEGA
jgi:hypothetical protein